MNIEQKVIAIVTERFDIGNVTVDADTSLRGLGVDSLDMVDIVTELEDVYGVSIPDEEIDSLRTVGDIAACVDKHMNC